MRPAKQVTYIDRDLYYAMLFASYTVGGVGHSAFYVDGLGQQAYTVDGTTPCCVYGLADYVGALHGPRLYRRHNEFIMERHDALRAALGFPPERFDTVVQSLVDTTVWGWDRFHLARVPLEQVFKALNIEPYPEDE